MAGIRNYLLLIVVVEDLCDLKKRCRITELTTGMKAKLIISIHSIDQETAEPYHFLID